MSDVQTKVCNLCHQDLPLTSYWIGDKKRGYLRGECKDCAKARLRARYAASPEARAAAYANSRKQALLKPRTPEQQRTYSLKNKFGIEHGGYEKMLAAQGGKCALCDRPDGGRVGTQGKWKSNHFNVDHDHKTGRVRGLLCHKCNVRVGAYEGLLADVGIHKLIAYLDGTPHDPPTLPRRPARTSVSDMGDRTSPCPGQARHAGRPAYVQAVS